MTATATIQPLASALEAANPAGQGSGAPHLARLPRTIAAPDRLRYERNLAEILAALGLDLDTPGTRDTPRRLLTALLETTDGYDEDPKLVTSFPTECHGGADCELAQHRPGASFAPDANVPLLGDQLWSTPSPVTSVRSAGGRAADVPAGRGPAGTSIDTDSCPCNHPQ